MSEYTDLIREARETTERLTQPNLVDRLADALEVSVARTAELETVIHVAKETLAYGEERGYFLEGGKP